MTKTMRWGFFALLALAVAGLAVLATQARTELRAFQEQPLDNVFWNVTQLELDLVRFQSEVELAVAQQDLSLAELRQRYDIFFSRTNNLNHGSSLSHLRAEAAIAPTMERLGTFLKTTTPLIDSSDADLRAALPSIAGTLDPLRIDLKSMSVQLVDLSAGRSDTRRSDFAVVLQQVAWATIALFAVLTVLLGLILYLNHRAEKTSEEAMRVSARLKATVATALDCVIVSGMDGLVIDYNAAAEQTFGYSRAEAIGRSLDELIVPPRLVAAHREGMARMVTTGEKRVVDAGRIQISAMRKGGEEFPVELSITSSVGPDGMILIAFIRDISQRLADEKAMLTARDEAIAAGQSKTNFLAIMSHEMRTPLNGVMASLEIATRDATDARQKKFLALAKSSAEQLLHHVNDVLDLTKVDAGHLSLENNSFDLKQLIADLIDAMTPIAQKNGTKLRMVSLTSLPMVTGDAFRIGQILQNLLSNAIKFTHEGSVTIEIEVLQQNAYQASVELRVIDTGIGIAAGDVDRVFDDFVTLDPSYSRTVGGTGLGLTISRRLAEAMGGTIGVESEAGDGSCFWVRLPLRKSKTVAPPIPGSKKPSALAKVTGALKILVVEDNETNRIVLEAMLHTLGHQVTLARDGMMGVDLARKRRYDMILMDISMPVMDGLTAAGLVRSGGASKSSHIVAVTAHTLAEDLARFRAAGMDDCLTKPVSEAALMRVLSVDVTPKLASQTAAATNALIDPLRIAELRAAMKDAGLSRALQSFRDQTGGTISKIINAASVDDPAHLKALCHEAAGASAMVGARQLYAALVEIEAKCRDNDLGNLPKLIAAMEPVWKDTEAALDQDWLPQR